jgi:cytochrome c-type biogenesis protein CcmH
MTLFWTLAGGLLLLASLVVLWPLWPGRAKPTEAGAPSQNAINLELFRQQLAELDADLANGKLDPEQHQSARRELERELLHDVGDSGATAPEHPKRGRWLLPVLALVLPALAVAIYQATGTPDIIPRLAATNTAPPTAGHGNGEMPPLDVLAERLAARLAQNPEDLEGWMMLGRTWFALGQPAQALKALEAAYALAPENLDVKLTYAEALAANNDNSLEGQPAQLISEVLAAEPDHTNARWLSGMLSFQRGQYTAAIQSWQRLLAQTDPNSRDAEDLRGLIEEARQRGGMVGGPAEPTKPKPAESAPTAANGVRIHASISIIPELADQVPANALVFVYAKAANGPPMPLAAQRLRVNDLPTTLTLDDSMAMNPAMKLSNFPEVVIGARISMTGQAMPGPGDWQGETGPVKVHEGGDPAVVPVVINQRLP